jgi:hypothetical protein
MSSAERRARRARRKKLRRNGKRLIFAGWIVVVVAVLIGVIGLANALRDDSDDVTTDRAVGASTSTTRRERPSATGTGGTVVVDLVPTTESTVAGGGTGSGRGRGGGTTPTTQGDVAGDTFGVRGTFGVVEVRAAPRAIRPRPNARPIVTMPSQVARDADGNAVVSGITISDPDYPGFGDIGVALIGAGRITVTLNQDVQLLTRNSEAFVGLVGPPAALNRALADLHFQSSEPVELLVTVTDWAYGDLSRSESGYASAQIL